jgi:hypothetical protein
LWAIGSSANMAESKHKQTSWQKAARPRSNAPHVISSSCFTDIRRPLARPYSKLANSMLSVLGIIRLLRNYLKETLMQNSKMALTVLLVLGTTAAVTMNPAEARRYRHVYNDYVVSDASCSPIPPPYTLYIYPTANWEPFFRRHVYRYGPILACALSTTNLVSVRF